MVPELGKILNKQRKEPNGEEKVMLEKEFDQLF